MEITLVNLITYYCGHGGMLYYCELWGSLRCLQWVSKMFFIIILRCYGSFSLCWHLHCWYKMVDKTASALAWINVEAPTLFTKGRCILHYQGRQLKNSHIHLWMSLRNQKKLFSLLSFDPWEHTIFIQIQWLSRGKTFVQLCELCGSQNNGPLNMSMP